MQLICIMRVFLDISYNGSTFHGWQLQPNAITIQEIIEDALSKILKDKIRITGSGRTDTGVHAVQQIAHLDLPDEANLEDIQHKLNLMTPRSISINSIRMVVPRAHARFDAINRIYHYHINHMKDPFKDGLSWQCPLKLDELAIGSACELLLKTTDFESFSRVKTDVANFNCQLIEAKWQPCNNGYVFRIGANRFLRGMVRAIVGTLMEVGKNKLSLNEFDLIIKSKNRQSAGMAAPPRGLFLQEVNYPEHIYINN